MIAPALCITLSEWETKGPDNCPELRGFVLDRSNAARATASMVNDPRLLSLTELRDGLQIRAFSHVGRIRIGHLRITILPKLRGNSLLPLLRYAYGYRRLKLVGDTDHLLEPCGLEDLLISQLNAEADELIHRGLQRAYVARTDRLASPRGRIDIEALAQGGALTTAALPCRHYPRIEDTLLNRVLLAGLKLAASLASSSGLRRESNRLATAIEEQVSAIALDSAVMDSVEHQLNRLTTNYTPAIAIIRLLVEAQGIALQGHGRVSKLPGFMYDMNAFFQALISRFLRDYLPDCDVLDEQGLKGMMRYNPNFHPARRTPTPRPDYVVRKDRRTRAILDAKYRDIWENDLPLYMLYQLVLYAVSQHDRPRSAIIYPTYYSGARETRIDVSDPVYGHEIGKVSMRPVNLERLKDLVADSTARGRRKSEVFATALAFGQPTTAVRLDEESNARSA